MAAATTKTATPKTKSAAGVKKGPGRPAGKKSNARNAMVKMQAFCEFSLIFDLANALLTRCDACLHPTN